jgi:acyl-CoA synthetase (AMP-forming)/AMP-acid ligase II
MTLSDNRTPTTLSEATILELIEHKAERQPDELAFTFVDYDVDPDGVAESLTWGQLHQRVRVVAAGVTVSDLVLVASGSLPVTTSGKVRRSTCAQRYRLGQFTRLGAS